jgi:hypothetical protein
MSEQASVPGFVQELVGRVMRDQGPGGSIEALMNRTSSRGAVAGALIGIGADPVARKSFEQGLDEAWRAARDRIPGQAGEVIIGAGLHAAIYSAMRRKMGYPMPLVLDASPRVGGSFAASRGPSFYLNSRNRPGSLSVPGEREALNVLPGALVQPADLSPAEYQRNNDLAYSIRATLAINANVITDAEVLGIAAQGTFGYELQLAGGFGVAAKRVVEATGLGGSVRPPFSNERVLSFLDFMDRLDSKFPLQGWRKVAVVGGGDSGRCAVEALLGQGPSEHWSVPSLDYPDQIDWYGVPNAETGGVFAACNRSRYRGIARFLPRVEGDTAARVQGTTDFAELTVGVDCAFVNGRPYDAVIFCAGFRRTEIPTDFQETRNGFFVGGREVAAARDGLDTSNQFFVIGPAAQLAMTDEEEERFGQVPENGTALFRYAAKTAALASGLPGTDQIQGAFAPESVSSSLSGITVDLDQLATASDDTPLVQPFPAAPTVALDALGDVPDDIPLSAIRDRSGTQQRGGVELGFAAEPRVIDLSDLALRSDDERF